MKIRVELDVAKLYVVVVSGVERVGLRRNSTYRDNRTHGILIRRIHVCALIGVRLCLGDIARGSAALAECNYPVRNVLPLLISSNHQ